MAADRRHPRAQTRASDADRELVVAVLRDHYSVGRLTDQELAARVEEAYGAQTVPELDALTLDLPASGSALPATRGPSSPGYTLTPFGKFLHTSFRMHLAIYVLVNVMLVGIWAAGGGGYFWPIWPILGWGIGVGSHYAPIMAGVGRRRRRPASYRLAAPASIHEVAASVGTERPSLRTAAAPDGTVTILFSDIVGSTALNEELGDVRWVELLREHHSIVRERIRAHGGFEVKAQGDGFMIAFPGARAAVECARAIQATLAEPLTGYPDAPIRVRMGMHCGEAIKEADDFYGRNVVLAARIAEQARGGEILASEVVKQLAESTGDIGFEDEREVELQGLAGTHRVFRVV